MCVCVSLLCFCMCLRPVFVHAYANKWNGEHSSYFFSWSNFICHINDTFQYDMDKDLYKALFQNWMIPPPLLTHMAPFQFINSNKHMHTFAYYPPNLDLSSFVFHVPGNPNLTRLAFSIPDNHDHCFFIQAQTKLNDLFFRNKIFFGCSSLLLQ